MTPSNRSERTMGRLDPDSRFLTEERSSDPSEITIDRMRLALGAFFQSIETNAAEYVFSWAGTRSAIDIKIFTAVDKRTGRARPTGEDTIRIIVFDKRAHLKIESWSHIVKRSGPNILQRLREKAGAALLRASFRPRCPSCNLDTMRVKRTALLEVWFCSDQSCNATMPLDP
jgi:ribosomal protein L37AE/L43A